MPSIPKPKALKMHPADDEQAQVERLLAALQRIEDGLAGIHELLESVTLSVDGSPAVKTTAAR